MEPSSVGERTVAELVDRLRRLGTETQSIEVKAGEGGFPTSANESIVALANSGGGFLIIGIDERSDFSAVALDDPGRYRDRVASLCRDAITPPLAADVDVVAFEGKQIVCARIPAVQASSRPAFLTRKGVLQGSYSRMGDADHRLSPLEVGLAVSERAQPIDDREPVADATIEDLDQSAFLRTVTRVAEASSVFAGLTVYQSAHRLGVLVEPHEASRLTLAGLLAFGTYPQSHFPQLLVSYVVHGDTSDPERRFEHSASIRGNIPTMVADMYRAFRQRTDIAADIDGRGRREVPSLPLVALREAVANALIHRTYHPTMRGSGVMVAVHRDRITIDSPGGIYGDQALESLGHVPFSLARNAALMSILSDTYLGSSDRLVAENRSSGLLAMRLDCERVGLPEPQFTSTPLHFGVSFSLQRAADAVRTAGLGMSAGPQRVIDVLARGPLRMHEITSAMGVSASTARRYVNQLLEGGIVEAQGDANSPHRTYHLTST